MVHLYLTADLKGEVSDFLISKTRNYKDAKRFFKKTLQSFHVSNHRFITVDKNPVYLIAIEQLKKDI
ncbi:Transposase (plasmid) [Bacillus thuringiensis serovar indiana]|nr:Transposase [Bacillus thuringiensis serovar indiana]MRB43036.1 DDE-type integrase/transposase/recombinase [Bacillus thuringiensis]MRB84789.1 DDE-type integrase/transposase/recombinase [Bacillus thuringiensis]